MIFTFAVDFRKDERDGFTAFLVDLPDGPYGSGVSPEAAFHGLMEASAASMTEFLLAGRRPQPPASADMATIGVTLPAQIGAAQADRVEPAPVQFVGARDGSPTMNYSWRNNVLVRDA